MADGCRWSRLGGPLVTFTCSYLPLVACSLAWLALGTRHFSLVTRHWSLGWNVPAGTTSVSLEIILQEHIRARGTPPWGHPGAPLEPTRVSRSVKGWATRNDLFPKRPFRNRV